MSQKEKGMDRRTFVKSTLATGAGVLLAASVGDFAWGKTGSDEEIAGLPLQTLEGMIRSGEITHKVRWPKRTQRVSHFSL
jgi:TAT (twin-arginine translocation) pathway signal sequence